MTKREKILASAVGFVLLVIVLQWGFSTYNGAIESRQEKISSLFDKIDERENRQIDGAMAQARMGGYVGRSLPSNLETARSLYQSLLTDFATDVGLRDFSNEPRPAVPFEKIGTQLAFVISGEGSLAQIVELLHRIQSNDYLHRITDLGISKRATSSLTVSLTVQALALNDALPDAEPDVGRPAWVNGDLEYYLLPIMNRNPLAPPNRAPAYAAEASPQALVGKSLAYKARFNDPDEDQELRYELKGDVPEGVDIDPQSGTISLKPTEVGEIEVLVAARDNGWPRLSSEQKIVFRVVEPPPEEKEPEKPTFDEAEMTFLTGVTRSRGEWMAMVHVRTSGETLRLREGDPFEIGEIKGTVVELNLKFAVLESDGERFVFPFNTALAEAKTNAEP